MRQANKKKAPTTANPVGAPEGKVRRKGGVDPQIQTANHFISFSNVGGQRAAVAHSEVVQQTPLIQKMKVATAAR